MWVPLLICISLIVASIFACSSGLAVTSRFCGRAPVTVVDKASPDPLPPTMEVTEWDQSDDDAGGVLSPLLKPILSPLLSLQRHRPSPVHSSISVNRRQRRVLFASLEHTFPEDGINIRAGGLGKVLAGVVKHHPGPLVVVLPAFGDVAYPAGRELEPMQTRFAEKHFEVGVREVVRRDGEVRYLVLDCPLFRKRKELYPQKLDSFLSAAFYRCDKP